ncbi:hypothetical protein ALC53_12368 [Atta colombica]|uniref:Uncharacterized protein n=1 Tax=Atta colombica TaxID=520822 RepID=A0A151HZC3_9HYME|nr:hypothetical protein ALC53_12368 [Atta colombica]
MSLMEAKLWRRLSRRGCSQEEEEVNELDESFLIINFASCTSDELIEFMLDFFDLTDEEELLHFCVIYFAAVTTEAEEEAEAAEIAAWIEKMQMGEMDQEKND